MRRTVFAFVLAAAATLGLSAQQNAPATGSSALPIPGFADYGQWETLGAGAARGGLSPNGQWLAYTIARSNRTNELRVEQLPNGTPKTIPFGTQAAFSADSKWIAYSIGHSEAETERATTPLENKFGVMNLATGQMTSVDGIESFTFSPDGAYVAMRHYPPERVGAAGPGAAPARGGGAPGGRAGGGAGGGAEDAVGGTLIVRQLATGRDTTFGNISEFAWQDLDHSHLVALVISADGKAGNGIQLFNPESGTLRVLDSSLASYTGLSWRKDSADLAVLRAKTDDHHDGATYSVLAWSGLGAAETTKTYDPSADTHFPAGMHTVSYRRLSWSEDGHTLFLGIAKWDEKPAPTGRSGRGASGATTGATPAPDVVEPAGVDIWHWTDVDVMSKQKLSAPQDRRRNMLAAWHLDTNTFTRLGDTLTEQVTPLRHTNNALVAEWAAYAMNRTIGRPTADLYLEDLATAARTKLKENINDRDAQVSPTGKYLFFLQDDAFWTINLATHAVANITKSAPTSFIDKESDETIVQKPAFGVAGWTKNDDAVLLYDKFDVWRLAPDGSSAQRLTDGAAEQVRHRLVRLDPADEFVDLTKPTYVTLFGLRSKKSGYGRLNVPAAGSAPGSVERLVWMDKSVDRLAKAKDADVFIYAAQDYDDSPDFFVAGADLHAAQQVTATNAFQSQFAWGRTEIVNFTVDKARALEGTLYYPAGYEAGKTYPMIVYMYEQLSDNVHRYVVPSDRDYYNTSVFTTHGYFVFEPDIVFRPRQPGLSVVECVTAGIKAVTAKGIVDPKRVGVVGHSWGGFDSAFLATHTNGIIAAAVAGAPITDLVSNYGNGHWSSGIAETDHIETGQQRMEVPLYDDLPDYVANSAVFNVSHMTVPLLLECGDADGTVFWHQSVELYNIARRAKKTVVMLVYNGEDHGLRQRKNQADYQQRILAWFGYYLKNDTPQTWITNGESFLDRDAEVKRLTGGAATPAGGRGRGGF